MHKYLIEFIGTFFLALTVALCALTPTITLTPFIVAGVLTGLIYAGGHISAAHYNPAVTTAFLIRGKISVKDAIPYVGAQFASAAAAAITAGYLLPKAMVAAPATFHAGPVMVSEILFTFLLVFVVLQVATAKGLKDNALYGVAIALTVAGSAFAAGVVMNPAVCITLGIAGMMTWDELIRRSSGEMIGGALAAGAFMITNFKTDFAKE